MTLLRSFFTLLATAALFAGCAAGGIAADGDDDDDDAISIDLLVIPPLGSAVPAQIVSGLGAAELADGQHNLHLDAGSAMTIHVRSSDSIPIDGASVRFRMRGAVGHDVVETTGPSGDVTLQLGAAIYDVEVDPNPLLYPLLPPRVFSGITVPPGGDPQEQTLTLATGLRVRGTLRDSTGGTLQQWQVSARRSGAEASRSTAATTSMVGAFEIFVPDAGTWVLKMSPPPLAVGQPTGTQTLEIAKEIPDFVFQFPPLENHVVTGTVTGIGGLVTSFSNITVRARAPQLLVDQPVMGSVISFNGSTTTDANGFFTLPVLNGSYTFSVEPPANFEYSHAVIPNLEVTSDVALVQSLTTLYPKVTVGGTAIDVASSTGTAGARVRFTSSDGTTAYQFADPNGTSGDGAFEVLSNVGNFTAEVLPAPDSGLVRTSQSVTIATAITDLQLGLSTGQIVRGKIYDGGDAVELCTVLALDPSTSTAVGSDESLSGSDGSWGLTIPFLATP